MTKIVETAAEGIPSSSKELISTAPISEDTNIAQRSSNSITDE